MSDAPSIGFVGFGEAAFHLAKGLRSAGIESISAFDIHSKSPGRRDLIHTRAEQAGVALQPSNAELAAVADILLSTVTADQASIAASQTGPYLESRHLYADLNSVSPAMKQSIARKIESSGARFVEVAVMAAVPPHGHKVPLLIGGKSAPEFSARLSPFGMKIEIAGEEIGLASATKMCRSVVIKGLEALLTECVLGAAQYGAAERVFQSLQGTFPGIDWDTLASYMVSRVVVHGERRAREMEEVVETLRSMGVDPFMAEATVRRMDWAAHLNLKSRFGGDGPKNYGELIEALSKVAVDKV